MGVAFSYGMDPNKILKNPQSYKKLYIQEYCQFELEQETI